MAEHNEKHYLRLLEKVPTKILIKEAARRSAELKKLYGRYGAAKEIRICPGCKKPKGAREMLRHKCSVSVSARMVFMYGSRKKQKAA